MAAVESVFMKAANLGRLCELTDSGGHGMVVEPYMIFTSPKGRRCLGCFLVSPEPEPGSPVWRTPELSEITGCVMREDKFQLRTSYDPLDKQAFPMVHFSLPTHDGRQRWADAGKPRDKTMLHK